MIAEALRAWTRANRMARVAYRADTHCPAPCGRFKATHLTLCDDCRTLRDAANNLAAVKRHKERKGRK